MPTWTRLTTPDDAATHLPAWFAAHMMLGRGAFGFLTTTGCVIRVARIVSIQMSSAGLILLDVILDRGGAPEAVDPAWLDRRYLGAPVTGAALATINLAQIVLAVEFAVPEIAETELVAAALAEPAATAEDLADAVASWPAPA